MTDWTEDDLRRLLVDESLDVDPPDRFRARLSGARRPAHDGPAWSRILVVAVVLAALVATWWAQPGQRLPTSAAPAAPAPRTQHLSLRVVAQLTVTGAEDHGDREVLEVSYEPNQSESHVGGVVTLYDRGAFDGRAFLAGAEPVRGPSRRAYFGSYPYTGDWGPVLTLAWQRDDGRWVSVQNFRGRDDSGEPAAVRAIDLRVADAVIVR